MMKSLITIGVCIASCLIGCSSSSQKETDAPMVWVVTAPLSVDQNEYQCIMVMTSGPNTEVRSAVCIMPRVGTTENNHMMATVLDDLLSIGFIHEKTIVLTNGHWKTVFLLQQKNSADDKSNPIRLQKTYEELGIPQEKCLLPEMIPALEKLIRETVNQQAGEVEK